MKSAVKPSKGFTLIEVLVAMVIMAILAVMAWQGVDGIVRSRDASAARLERALRLNTVLAQWEQDLTSVQDSTLVPALAFDGASLRLTRRAPGGLQMVMWYLANDAAGSNTARWQRWAAPVTTRSADLQEQWLRSLQLAPDSPGLLTMQEGLAQWQVFCFRGNDNAWSNCQSSNDVSTVPVAAGPGASTPQQVRQTLPSGVRVVLTFAPGSGNNGTLTRDVALGPQSP